MDFVIYHKTNDTNAINVKTFNAGITHTVELLEILSNYTIKKDKLNIQITPVKEGSVIINFIIDYTDLSVFLSSTYGITHTPEFKDLYKRITGKDYISLVTTIEDIIVFFKKLSIKLIKKIGFEKNIEKSIINSNSKNYTTVKKDNNVPAITFNTTPTEKDFILRQDFHKYITEEDNEDETYRVILYMQSAPVNDNNTATFQVNDNYTKFLVTKNFNFNARFLEDCGFESIEDFNKHKPYKFDVEIKVKINKSKEITKIISLNDDVRNKSIMEYDTIYTAKEEDESKQADLFE